MAWASADPEIILAGDGIDFVTDALAISGVAPAQNPALLRGLGVRAVVDASNRPANSRFPGIVYLTVPIEDPDERLPLFIGGAVAFIHRWAQSGPVLIHCVAGISRSPTLAVCYLHERLGLSLEAALVLVRERRPQAAPHGEFLRLLRRYYDGQLPLPSS